MKRFLPLLFGSLAMSGCALAPGANSLPRGSEEDFKTYSDLGHYKAFAVTTTKGENFARAWGWAYQHSSVTSAIDKAIEGCRKSASKHSNDAECRVHSLGNVTVHGLSEEETDDITNRYASDPGLTNDDVFGTESGS